MKKIIWVLLLLVLFSFSERKKKLYAVAQIKTESGEILFWMYDETPIHKQSFIKLAKAGYWDSLTFNRVIKNFVIQGGCPDTPKGFADSPYLLSPEISSSFKHEYGAVGAGRDDNAQKLSAGCQFYIVQSKKGLSYLDGDYTIFGKVIKGMEVVEAIVAVEKTKEGAPLKPVVLDVNIIELSEKQLSGYGIKLKK